MAVRGKGMGPLDPVEDFQKPTVVPGSPAADALPEAAEEAEEEFGGPTLVEDSEEAEETSEAEQLEIPGTQTVEPPVIRDGKMLAEFVRPHFDKEEGGDRYVGFEISLALTPAHDSNGHLPAKILEEWLHMRNGNSKRIDVTGVDAQTIAIGLVSNDPESDLILVAAAIQNPVLAVVKDTGSGKSKTVIRLKFKAVVELEKNFSDFAVNHFGDPIWFSIQRTQGSLLEE